MSEIFPADRYRCVGCQEVVTFFPPHLCSVRQRTTPEERLAELEERLRALAAEWEGAAHGPTYRHNGAGAGALLGAATQLRALLGEAAR